MAVETKRDQELIDKYVEVDTNHPGRANARLREPGVHVWAVIGYLHSVRGDKAQVMQAYGLTPEMVAAAEAYYRLNHEYIDAKLLLESDRD